MRNPSRKSSEKTVTANNRRPAAGGERGKLFAMRGKERIGGDDQALWPQLGQGCEHLIEVVFRADVQDMKPQRQSSRCFLQLFKL